MIGALVFSGHTAGSPVYGNWHMKPTRMNEEVGSSTLGLQ